ncbi:hypothetical protein MLD38_032798 [Melastoma candidum]|uniref:Uncharacterized protein n=1 Tax=Melastoma candidum TaxID=119954 RepID=A0ACB9M6I2_9MYRT|nr:hypothetical protein MLD38_032798 [Melastoma candidum]
MNSATATVVLLAVIGLLYSSSPAYADSSVQGCGGFVEASPSLIKSRKPSDGKLDYSDIVVELQTFDGLVKERTQCAPNGYYFIPVYDKGSFQLKVIGPEGWSWHPEKVAVTIDDTGCNANNDINFQFTGFSISGRVVGAVAGESCPVKNGGPSGVNVELMSLNGECVASVTTSSGGHYMFPDVVPGSYKLQAAHPDLKIEVRGSTEVQLGFGNVVLDNIFFVRGYDIYGSVVAQGNPILGVHVYLFSRDDVNVDCPNDPANIPGQGKALCHAISDADGMFTFSGIPCGTYELRPYYKGENTVFDITPPVLPISVKHRHVTVPHKFQVTGFSIGGRVVDENHNGVEGVKIIVDGHERSVTDKEGYYKLDQVTSNRYTVQAFKEHYKFEVLKDYLVLPNMAAISDIKAASYDVCGVVRMVANRHKAKVALTHGPDNVKPQVKQTDESGNFCFEVPAGEYRLSALAGTQESMPGVIFSPPYADVTVKTPIFNVEFSEALVSISGYVDCKESCSPSVSVTLVRLSDKTGEEKKAFSLTEDTNEFTFPNLFPGKYHLKVKHNPPETKFGVEDNWCWEKGVIEVNLGSEDVKGVKFSQKGYLVNVISSHDVDAFMKAPDGSPVHFKIKKGSQHICVEFPGVHELSLGESCVHFGSSSVKIDTAIPSPIYIKGEKYLLKGHINVDIGDFKPPEEIAVEIMDSTGKVIHTAIGKPKASVDEQASSSTYEYSLWANVGDELKLAPQDARKNGDKKILFYPRQHQILVKSDGCQSEIAPFSGRVGLYIEGSVSPALAGVDIKILAAGDSQYISLRKGESAIQTITGKDGSFVGGPLYDDIAYTVEASKPGYHIRRTGAYSFSCQKLGQIQVHINSMDKTPEPVGSVLLSLSGDDGYRNNSISGASGTFLFYDLFPGSFYLRPLLKEYAFTPAAQAIELSSGEAREVVFQATRVAYSVMGMVTLLSGQPRDGVLVEARSELKGFYEEALTDSNGNYRLRGLVPGTRYTVKVARKDGLKNARLERASPESLSIQVQAEDIKGVDFLIFEQPEKTILSGHVEREKAHELYPSLLVEVKSASDPAKIMSVFSLPLSNFFQVKDLPRSKLILQLRPESPLNNQKFESEAIEVDLEQNAQIHVGPMKYKIVDNHLKQDLTPASVFPLLVGVSVIALFISMPRLKDLYESTVSASAPGFSISSKKEVKKPVIRKKA